MKGKGKGKGKGEEMKGEGEKEGINGKEEFFFIMELFWRNFVMIIVSAKV